MTIPEIDFPSSDSDFIKDPYPLLKDLREMSPVVLDKTQKSFVIQVTALRRDIDKLVATLKPLGLISVSRTGAVAMTKGDEVFTQ